MNIISVKGAMIDFPGILIIIHGNSDWYPGILIIIHGKFLGIDQIFLICTQHIFSYSIPFLFMNKIISNVYWACSPGLA